MSRLNYREVVRRQEMLRQQQTLLLMMGKREAVKPVPRPRVVRWSDRLRLIRAMRGVA